MKFTKEERLQLTLESFRVVPDEMSLEAFAALKGIPYPTAANWRSAYRKDQELAGKEVPPIRPGRGPDFKQTEEAKAKISGANSGRTCSEETRAKMSAAHKGKTRTPEHQAKINAALRARTLTIEARAKALMEYGESSRKPIMINEGRRLIAELHLQGFRVNERDHK